MRVGRGIVVALALLLVAAAPARAEDVTVTSFAIRGRRKSGKMFRIMRRYRICTPKRRG